MQETIEQAAANVAVLLRAKGAKSAKANGGTIEVALTHDQVRGLRKIDLFEVLHILKVPHSEVTNVSGGHLPDIRVRVVIAE